MLDIGKYISLCTYHEPINNAFREAFRQKRRFFSIWDARCVPSFTSSSYDRVCIKRSFIADASWVYTLPFVRSMTHECLGLADERWWGKASYEVAATWESCGRPAANAQKPPPTLKSTALQNTKLIFLSILSPPQTISVSWSSNTIEIEVTTLGVSPDSRNPIWNDSTQSQKTAWISQSGNVQKWPGPAFLQSNLGYVFPTRWYLKSSTDLTMQMHGCTYHDCRYRSNELLQTKRTKW